MQTPEVSVVICYHTGSLLYRCLESLKQSEGATYEVIVVSSIPMLPLPIVATVVYSQEGPAAKRNLGVQHATGAYLVFLDDDVEVAPDTLAQIKKALDDNPHIGMVFGTIYKMEEGRRDEFDDCGSWLTWTGFLYSRAGSGQVDDGQYHSPTPILASKSATCAIRRTTFQRAGSFDPDYYILGEESLLAFKVWLIGEQVWYIPSIISWHAFGTNLKSTALHYSTDRVFRNGPRNYIWFLTSCLPWWLLPVVMPIHITVWLVAALGFLLRGEHWRTTAILRAFWYHLTHLHVLLRKRREIQAMATVNPSAFLHHIWRWPHLSYYVGRMNQYLNHGLHG